MNFDNIPNKYTIYFINVNKKNRTYNARFFLLFCYFAIY